MIYHGWTKELTQAEKDNNELRSCRRMAVLYPDNPYWKARAETLTEQAYARIDELMGDEPIRQSDYDDLSELPI